MSGPAESFDANGLDDAQARRWLAALRTGSPDEKAEARRGLAQTFESRGMVAEAVDLLVTNAREGYRDAELFQTLARMYRRLGNEYLAASATLEATRLSSRQPADAGQAPASRDPSTGRTPMRPPSATTQRPRAASRSSWRAPLTVAGWIAVIATTVAAIAVASQSPFSAAIYVVSAAALGLLLSGSGAARRLVRLPDGPLGDGALLFIWLLALLAAGALLPRPLTLTGSPGQPNESGSPAVSGTRAPTPSPAASPSSPATPIGSPTP